MSFLGCLMSKEIGFRLKQERRRVNKSQAELAKIGGCARSTQARYETGETIPGDKYLWNVSAVDIDIGYVLNGVKTDYSSADIPKPIAISKSQKLLNDDLIGMIMLLIKSMSKANVGVTNESVFKSLLGHLVELEQVHPHATKKELETLLIALAKDYL